MPAQRAHPRLRNLPIERKHIVDERVKDEFTKVLWDFYRNAVLKYVPNQAGDADSSDDIWDPSWNAESLYHKLELAVKTTVSHNIANQQQSIF